jgi:predicted Fe-Mo cluster-binding NifX family protein
VKLCITTVGDSLDSNVDPRFGRAAYFLIINPETMQFEALPNVAASGMSGVGIQAAQTIAGKGVKTVLTGNVGPNAFQALSAAGIKVIVGASGTVKEVIEKYKKGELKEGSSPTVGGHFGRGGGMGMGRGRRKRF